MHILSIEQIYLNGISLIYFSVRSKNGGLKKKMKINMNK